MFEVGQSPTIKEAQAIADDIFAAFVSQVREGWAKGVWGKVVDVARWSTCLCLLTSPQLPPAPHFPPLVHTPPPFSVGKMELVYHLSSPCCPSC